MKFISKKDLPVDARVSEDMKEQAHFFISISHFGYTYHIPVTGKLKQFMGIRVRKGKPELLGEKVIFFEEFFRNIISQVYYQVWDTVGAEMHRNLSIRLQEGFKHFFNEGITKLIEDFLTRKKNCPDIKCLLNVRGICGRDLNWRECFRVSPCQFCVHLSSKETCFECHLSNGYNKFKIRNCESCSRLKPCDYPDYRDWEGVISEGEEN